MHNRLRKVVLAAGLATAAAGVGLALAPGAAQAAPLTVSGCPTSSGSQDTGALRITIDDAALAGGAMVPIHDRTGAVTYPASKDDGMSSPVCGLQRLADGSLHHEWLYCTAAALDTCATDPMVRKGSAATGVTALTDVDKARLAWLVDHPSGQGTALEASDRTAATRALRQRLVWCVTEKQAAGVPAPGYYNNGTDVAGLLCPNWPTIDPTLNLNPTVAVTAPAGAVAVGAVARFAVRTNTSPLALAVTGLTGLALCPDATGATLVGGVLTIAAPDVATPVAVCATRAVAGTGTLAATIAARTGRTLEFWQRADRTQFCQGMLSSATLSTANARAQADVVFAADAPTTTTTTVVVVDTTVVNATTTTTVALDVGVSTTPTTPAVLDTAVVPAAVTLPRTGASRHDDSAFWALALVLAGVMLVALGRRPAHR